MPRSPNIFFIAIILFALISSFFVQRMGITPDLWIVSVIFMILFAIPSFVALIHTGKKKAVFTLILLGLFALFIESVALHTGFPYGNFYYENVLGPSVFGLAPLTVPFAWVPLVIGVYAFIRITIKKHFVLFTALGLVIVDLVIDPGAYRLGIWIWENPGVFYGVPMQNFFGWFISGIIGAGIMNNLVGYKIKSGNYSLLISSLVGIVSFWTGISFFLSIWIPMMVGVLILIFLMRPIRAQSQQ